MLGFDLILGAAVLALFFTNIRDRRLLKQNELLLKRNDSMSEYLLGDGDNEHLRCKLTPHNWSNPLSDVVYKSKSPVSYDRVVVSTSVCSECQLVHKYITEGHILAQKKSLLHLEGFYLGGVRALDHGCITNSD